ncbi:MAG: carbohydrate ABC transporter permease [Chloroflexi bacterium]|nr:carbohydrate ABC transporter permease [Chloroflexota bacterium]MCY3936959.1 carbohydrate ABC transporter permease [Chloroflexota bacterium]
MRIAGVSSRAEAGQLVKERHSTAWWVGNISKMTVVYTILIVTALVFLYPYFWMVGNAFKTNEGFYTDPYRLIPEQFSLDAMRAALGIGRVHIYLKNSTIFAVVGVAGQLLVDALAAFAFARLSFRGRDVLFVLVLATLMLPYSVVLIPSYLIVYWFGLANTYVGVMLPGFAGAFGIFLLRQFFLNIPSELEDAARIDGATTFRIFWQIIVPLAKPALLTLGLFIFIFQWSSYVWPLIVLKDWDKYPLTVGIALFRSTTWTYWPNILAATTLGTLPLIALFLLVQRYIIGGITLSGLKG